MRLIVQRVLEASVSVPNRIVGSIGPGYFVLVGFHETDTKVEVEKTAEKLLNLRVMADSEGRMNLSITDAAGEILIVSQFTLYADASQRRPSFIHAADPKIASPLFDYFVALVRMSGLKVETGIFGEYMTIQSIADGPVTITLDSDNKLPKG